MPTLLTSAKTGSPVTLGPKKIAVGSECRIYEVANNPAILAAVFKTAAGASKPRIEALVKKAIPGCALPTEILMDGLSIAGYLMDRQSGDPLLGALGSLDDAQRTDVIAKIVSINRALVSAGLEVADQHLANYLLSDKGVVARIDLGPAIGLTTGGRRYPPGAGVRREYLSPELQDAVSVKGHLDGFSTATDVSFALGSIAFHILTGGSIADYGNRSTSVQALMKAKNFAVLSTPRGGVVHPEMMRRWDVVRRSLKEIIRASLLEQADQRPSLAEWGAEFPSVQAPASAAAPTAVLGRRRWLAAAVAAAMFAGWRFRGGLSYRPSAFSERGRP